MSKVTNATAAYAAKIEAAIQEVKASKGLDPDENNGTLQYFANRSYDGGWFVVYEWELADGGSLFYCNHSNCWDLCPDASDYFSNWDDAEDQLEAFQLLDEPDAADDEDEEVAIWQIRHTTNGDIAGFLRKEDNSKIFEREEAKRLVALHEAENPYRLVHGEVDKPVLKIVKAD